MMGPNGAGKTSLLEAIYVLATTRSFRTHQLLDCRRFDSTEFRVEGEVQTDRRSRLVIGTGPDGRDFRLNGQPSSLIDYLRILPVVAWTSADDQLVSGPPEARRRFLDQGIVGVRPAALSTLSRYRRALSQKRALLKHSGRGVASWNEVLADCAAELMRLRRDYVEQLAAALRDLAEAEGLSLPGMSIEYRPCVEVERDETAEVLETLKRARPREQQEGRPLVGPHRDELVLRWNERGIRGIASAGERKLLGLVLAAARGRVLATAGRAPIYLLDDADSDLDADRLRAAWGVFRDAGQVFVSSSRAAAWQVAPEASRWSLEGGRLRPYGNPKNTI